MDRVVAMEADLERKAAVLLSISKDRATLVSGSAPGSAGRPVVFAGLGSSLFASMDAASTIRTVGVAATAEYASSPGMPPSPELILVAVSASGQTREVVSLAERHRGRSLVIGVTNDPGSPLAQSSDEVLPLGVGEETAGISTLTYAATVVTLRKLGERFGLESWSVPALGAPLPTASIEAAAGLLDGVSSIDVIGPAWRLGGVSQAALMLREGPRLPAHAYETTDWLHTGVYLALPGHRVVLFTGSPADSEVIDTVRRRGGEVIAIAPQATDVTNAAVTLGSRGGDPATRAVIEGDVVDRLALELWRRASADR